MKKYKFEIKNVEYKDIPQREFDEMFNVGLIDTQQELMNYMECNDTFMYLPNIKDTHGMFISGEMDMYEVLEWLAIGDIEVNDTFKLELQNDIWVLTFESDDSECDVRWSSYMKGIK